MKTITKRINKVDFISKKSSLLATETNSQMIDYLNYARIESSKLGQYLKTASRRKSPLIHSKSTSKFSNSTQIRK